MKVDSDDEQENDGRHPDNVENDDDFDAIKLYKATEDDLDDELGNTDDA